MGRVLGLILAMAAASSASAEQSCEALIEQSNAQLEAMRGHAEAIEQSLQQLNAALQRAERRNAEQTRHIERLEAELRTQRSGDPAQQERQRREFFGELRRILPLSTVYEVLPDRLIVAADPVFIYGKGEIGAEGQDRLVPVADALRGLVARMPAQFPWRLRIEGHSDSRPVRHNPRFTNNWELSAARSLGLLRFLVSQGLPEDRMTTVGMAETQLRDPGDSSAAHRRNRRIEIHLVYGIAAE